MLVFKDAFLRSEENFNLNNFPTLDAVQYTMIMYDDTPSSVGKLLRLTFSSDLGKPCLKTGESLSPNKI